MSCLTLLSEIEAVVEQAIDKALEEFPQHRPERSRLIAHTIQALESDPDWVELYGITGELKVPASGDNGASKEFLTRVRDVGYSITLGVVARRRGAYHSTDVRKRLA